MIGQSLHHDQLNEASSSDASMVVLGARLRKQRYVSVGSNNEGGAFHATSHLIDQGCSRGRSDAPVALGAVFPLVRTQEETRLITPVVGNVARLDAWGQRLSTLSAAPAGLVEPPAPAVPLGPFDTPPLAEGEPHTKPIAEDAAHFLIGQIHAHPHQVTVYAAGPLTDIALAIALDPHFAELPGPGGHGGGVASILTRRIRNLRPARATNSISGSIRRPPG